MGYLEWGMEDFMVLRVLVRHSIFYILSPYPRLSKTRLVKGGQRSVSMGGFGGGKENDK